MSELTRRSSKKGASQNHLRQGTLFDNFLVTREPPPTARIPVEAKNDGSEEQATVEKTSTKDDTSQVSTNVLEPSPRSPSGDLHHIESSLCSSGTQSFEDVDVENNRDDCTINQEHISPSGPCDVDLAPSCSLVEDSNTDSCTVELRTPSSLPILDTSREHSSHIIDLTIEEETEDSPILIEGSPILESPPVRMAPPSQLPFRRLSLRKWKEVKDKPCPDAPFPSASMQHVRDSVLSVQAMPIGLGQRQRKTTRASPEPSTSREPLKLGLNTDDIATRRVGSYRSARGPERQADANDVLSSHGDLHPAISSIFGLASELEDVKEPCQQHWNQKWRPRRAEHILGNEQNACYLREWMHALRLHFNTTPSSHGRSSKSKKKSRKRKRGGGRPEIVREVARKRQRAGNLDGWLVDDEDDEDEIDEGHGGSEDSESWSLPSSLDPGEPQSISFGKKIRNTMLLVGPPGCGKTAAVYACAEELGWNVFEVYPGLGKRGGTHLDELIGDVGKNHTLPQPLLFRRGRSEPPSPARKCPTKDTSDKVPEAEIRPQSVVLIEEADVVFADEAGFWPSVVAFIRECRRPVIITCNDISLIPLDILPLQTTLNFNAAPASLTLSLLNAIRRVEGRPPVEPEDAPDLRRQFSAADLRQRICQCQLGLTDSTCGKPVELADVAANVDFSFQVKLEKAMTVETEPDERKNLYALRQCLRGADAASFLDACVLLARPHELEIADDHPDDEVGYKALKTRQRTTIPVHPEYYSRDIELATTGLMTFKGILERNLPGISLDDVGETGQWASREEYRRRLWEGLKTDPALEGMVDLPRLYLDYRPVIGMMVKAEDEEIAKVTGRVKGRSSRLTERSCRWLNATEELRGAVRAAGGLAGG